MGRAKKDLAGTRFGRLMVIRDSGDRARKGEVVWDCLCDCGTYHRATGGNLKSGTVTSCGCLARELSSIRGKARAAIPPECSIDGCTNQAREYDRTLCRKHGQRMRRYGDPLFVTPEEQRRESLRASNLRRRPDAKPTTYRKLLGRHEHRVIGERIAGRPLRSDEHVHHIDEDKHNNDPSNLMVMPAIEHLRLHAKLRRKA